MAALALVAAVACGGEHSLTGPVVTPPRDTTPAFAGFDIGVYPGDAALQAWTYPSSPYRWTGYYLPAPCHRETSFTGKRAFMTSLGWGLAVLYVGQQDWANMDVATALRAASFSRAFEGQVACSASLLSSAQGATEAADAVAKLSADGFPDGTTVFLDVEHVTTISDSLLAYYRAWATAVATDGHYKPGIYVSKSNAQTFYDQAIVGAQGAAVKPTFWIASWSNFSLSSRPTDVGLDFAELWQGRGEVTESHNGVTLTIDVDVADRNSPSGD